MKKIFSLVAATLAAGSLWASTDVTATYLTNGDLGSLDGWTIDTSNGFEAPGYTAYKTDGAVPVIEFYHSWHQTAAGTAIGSTKTFNFSQSPTLPAGYYRLQVNAFYREGNGNGMNEKAYIYAGDKQQYVVGLSSAGVAAYAGNPDIYKAATAFSLGDFSNEFDFKVETEGTVNLGFHGYIDTYCSWCILGPVHLYQYTVDDYLSAYEAQYVIADSLNDLKMNAAVLAALNSAMVDKSTLTEIDDVIAAETALKSANAAASASADIYVATKATLDKYASVPAEVSEAFAASISDIAAAYNDCSMTEDQSSAIEAAFASVAKGIYTAGTDVTALASSAWTAVQGEDGEKRAYGTGYQTYGTSAFEAGKVMYQNIGGLLPGTAYTVQFYAVANSAWIGSATGADIAQTYANDSVYNISVLAQTSCTPASDDYLQTFNIVVGKDSTLEFGMQNVATGGNWYVAQVKSIVSAGNTNIASYATTYVGIDAIRDAISTASATITAGTSADLVAAFMDSLKILSLEVDTVAHAADSLYNAVAISGLADSLIALLPTAADVEAVVTKYNAAVAALNPSSDPIAGDYSTIKVWDFATPAVADTAADGKAQNTVMTYSEETVTVAGTASNLGTDYFAGFAMQGANKFFYYNGGLYSGNGGGRKVGVLELSEGQRVIVKTSGTCMTLADTSNAEEASVETVDGVTTYVYNITADGILALSMTRYFVIYSVEIQAKTKLYNLRYYDFATPAAADTTADGKAQMTVMTYSDETVNVGGTASNLGTEYFAGLAMQGANKFMYYNGGLYSGNGGGRKVGVLDVEAGQVVTVKTNGECMNLVGTDNATQASVETADGVTTYVYNVTADGILALNMTRYYVIYSISVDQAKQVVNTGWDFATPAAADTTADGKAQKTVMTYSDETVNVGGTASNLGTEYFAGLAMQGANKFMYYNGGLYSGNGGGRKVGVLDLVAGTTVVVKTSGTCMTLADPSNAEEASVETVDGVTTYVYNITADGILALTMTRYFVIYSIDVYAPKSDLQKPVIDVVAHNDWEYAPVVLTCKTKNSTIYYTLTPDSVDTVYTYVDTIKVTSSCTLTAWSELNGKTTKVVTKDLVAGYVATPTATCTATKDEERTVVFASAATAANLVVNGEVVTNPYTTTISASTDFEVVAVYSDTIVGTVTSDTLNTTIEAGYAIALNSVTFSVVEQSDTLYRIVLKNSNTDLIGTPTASISYELYPSGEKFEYTAGDTLSLATHQRITAVANAEGYATSEEAVLWTREPAKLELVWSEDFKTPASNMTSGTSYGVVLQESTFSATGTYGTYDMCPVQYQDSLTSNANFGVQSGTSWLERNASGYLGLYNFNSGPRRFGINNLRKTQVVKLTVQDPAQIAVENDVLVLDAANSVGNTLYYNCVKDGAAVLSMSRYYCIWSVEVYNNPDVTPSPNIYIAGGEGDSRNVAIVPASFPYEQNAWTYYALFDSLRVDSTLVAAATDSTDAVYSYDTVSVYTDFQEYTAPFAVSKPNNTVLAYTVYEGKASEQNLVEINCDSVSPLILPTITWVEKGDEGHTFNVADANLIEQGLYPTLNYTYNDVTGSFSGESNDLTLSGSGWLKIQAVLPGLDTAYVVSRYVAANRESYTEVYASILDGDTLVTASVKGDFESAANANTVGDYPTSLLQVGGKQYVHYAVNSNFAVMAMPFSYSVGENVITNAAGEELVLGEDYRILTLHTRSAANLKAYSDLSLLTTCDNLESAVRTSGTITTGVAVLFQSLSDKVGSEVILETEAGAIASTEAVKTVPSNGGWRICANSRYQEVALESAAYVLNEKGTKFVYTEAPVIPALGAVILVDPTAVETLGNEIVLVDESYQYTALNITKDSVVWTTGGTMAAANAAGWASTENPDDYASFQTTSKSYTINPETDAAVSVSAEGITVKNNMNKYLNLYVTGVDSVVVYGLSCKAGATDRYIQLEATSLTTGAAVAATSPISENGASVVATAKIYGNETYRLRISAPMGDCMVYAVKLIAGNSVSGISNIAVDGQSVDAIYDLQGRKVQNVRKGELYVIDGARIQVK